MEQPRGRSGLPAPCSLLSPRKGRSKVTRLCYRAQRTIGTPAEITGTGFLTGATVRLRFLPAPPHTGIVFQRSDLWPMPRIPAHIENVTGTDRRTTLGGPPAHEAQRSAAQLEHRPEGVSGAGYSQARNPEVGLVEHVLAALSGL